MTHPKENNLFKAGGQHCKYTRLENGVHELVVMRATRAAADEYFDILEALMTNLLAEGYTPDDTVSVLADFRAAGNPPMNHMFRRTKTLLTKYPVRPRARYANLYPSSHLLSLAQTFISLLNLASRDKVHLFIGEKREAAIAWLLEKE